MNFERIPYLTLIIWVILGVAFCVALFTQQWSNAFVTIVALGLTLLPTVFSNRFHIQLPLSFLAAISLFFFSTLFLGEIFDFYNKFWWWDVLLHGSSAVGFGIIGFLFIFYLFQGDRYDAPPWALGLIAFCVALSIGALWEIFEFVMDQIFGLNMQKSGLIDTMWDLIVDTIGASFGAISGFFWLKGQSIGLSGMIDEFIHGNRALFKRFAQITKNKDSTKR
ncbi:MAG: hypothetical protein KJN60_01145 [Boseongicola sp.]|nr:hypothetical protein [Boseongicola sp.]